MVMLYMLSLMSSVARGGTAVARISESTCIACWCFPADPLTVTVFILVASLIEVCNGAMLCPLRWILY